MALSRNDNEIYVKARRRLGLNRTDCCLPGVSVGDFGLSKNELANDSQIVLLAEDVFESSFEGDGDSAAGSSFDVLWFDDAFCEAAIQELVWLAWADNF